MEWRWQVARLLAHVQADAEAAGELDWLVPADSAMVRVHHHFATARRTRGKAATAQTDEEGDRRAKPISRSLLAEAGSRLAGRSRNRTRPGVG